VWVLTVTEGPPTAFGCVVGRFPSRVLKEYAQPLEVIEVQMQLLPAEWHHCSTLGVILPNAIPLLGVRWSTPLAGLILPNGEPSLQESARYAQRGSDWPGHETRERLRLRSGQVRRAM
jgi:hypothetical protein